jgi:hypothetical protein
MQQAFLASALQESNWLAPHPSRLTSGKTIPFTNSGAHPTSHSIKKDRWAQKPVRTFCRRKMISCLCLKSNHDSSAVQSVVTTWTDISRLRQTGCEGDGLIQLAHNTDQMSTINSFLHCAKALYWARASSQYAR